MTHQTVTVPRLAMKTTIADAIWRYDNGEFTAARVAMVKAQDILSAASPPATAAPEGVDVESLAETIILTAGYQLLTENNARRIAQAILAALTPPETEGWREIESAPKDGWHVDVWCPEPSGGYRIADAWWSDMDGKWLYVGQGDMKTWPHQPSHWRPLPSPPVVSEKG